jgi:uncharacterized protein YjaZ
MKKIFFLIPAVITHLSGDAQTVSVSDVSNFFQMKDSVRLARDTASQLAIIHRLYMEKASEGLIAFMRNKTDLDRKWLSLLETQPVFWDSLQMRFPLISKAATGLEKQIGHFAVMYPGLKPAKTFFLIGIRQQGGTIRGNLSIIGAEVVLSNATTTEKDLIRMGLHEFVHTQQARPDFQKIDVLTSSIREGAGDFIASLVSGIPTDEPYTRFGKEHEQQVWEKFREEMNTTLNDNWVSTGDNPRLMARDLGYFVGYQICQSYYARATDKKTALKEIIELDYSSKEAVLSFFRASQYGTAFAH